jgi:hypothetical protein
MQVLRGRNTLIIDGIGYSLDQLTTAAFEEAKLYGSKNPAFHMPGWFYSGSPYGTQILDLATRKGLIPIVIPDNFTPEYMPKLGYIWRATEPAWIDYYNCRDIYDSTQAST